MSPRGLFLFLVETFLGFAILCKGFRFGVGFTSKEGGLVIFFVVVYDGLEFVDGHESATIGFSLCLLSVD